MKQGASPLRIQSNQSIEITEELKYLGELSEAEFG
jgi:hypothetical protein